jgi:SAM-dependent methyltransferase
MNATEHWDAIYTSKQTDGVSWFQTRPQTSLALIASAAAGHSAARILDAGSGASTLIDALLDAGHTQVSALDISQHALDHTRARLGPRAPQVNWIVTDLTHAALPPRSVDIWHDRAVFHFLRRASDR